MILPLQITFRNMKPSAAVEGRVREEAGKLETFYDGIIRCRAVIELPHKHRRKGDLYNVRIELTVPGAELIVKREPSLQASLRQVDVEKQSKSYEVDAAHKDIYVVIRDAFREARRQLQDFVRRQRGQTKLHTHEASGRGSQISSQEKGNTL